MWSSTHIEEQQLCIMTSIKIFQYRVVPTTTHQKWIEVIFLHRQGESRRAIAKKGGMPKSTAYDIIANFKKRSTVEPQQKIGQPSTWTRKDVYNVNEWIKANPDITAKQLTQIQRSLVVHVVWWYHNRYDDWMWTEKRKGWIERKVSPTIPWPFHTAITIPVQQSLQLRGL